eukprot:GILJ01012223.1.p1 GENE.GILJ01012223.1~~GILJ01012223.1.p1  ORF type:complete len:182 (+),score=19.51 GILJ01012223.1:6-551(+)
MLDETVVYGSPSSLGYRVAEPVLITKHDDSIWPVSGQVVNRGAILIGNQRRILRLTAIACGRYFLVVEHETMIPLSSFDILLSIVNLRTGLTLDRRKMEVDNTGPRHAIPVGVDVQEPMYFRVEIIPTTTFGNFLSARFKWSLIRDTHDSDDFAAAIAAYQPPRALDDALLEKMQSVTKQP